MFDMSEEILENIMGTVMIESRASRKLNAGEELTPEEQDKLLQVIYRQAINGLKELKKVNSTKAKMCLKFLSITSRLVGEEMKGLGEATYWTRKGISYGTDNYKRILEGVAITANNATRENLMTLLEQNKEVDNFNDAFIDLNDAVLERVNSYKKDYKSPIEEEAQEDLKQSRLKIVTLSKQYVPKKVG